MTRLIDRKIGVSTQQSCIDKILAKDKDDNFHTFSVYLRFIIDLYGSQCCHSLKFIPHT